MKPDSFRQYMTSPANLEGSELYYVQDSRTTVGNDVLWWRIGGKGYSTDLREAAMYSKDEAERMHKARDTDIPWPKSYIDTKTRPCVDFQYLDKSMCVASKAKP